jgi:broad specificity phosphatase PhoE
MAKSNEIRVLLARTGETEWERAGRLAGAADVPMTEGGRDTARRAADALTDVHLSAIFCGPDEASQVTAHELARTTGGKVRVVQELGEIDLGLWEGLRETELEEKCPRAHRQWIEDPASVHVPEGETVDDARARIMQGLARSLDKSGNGAVGVVLRPIALGLVTCELTGTPTTSLWSIIKSGPLTQWRTVQREAIRKPRIKARAGA